MQETAGSQNKIKIYLIVLAFILFSISLIGLFWLAATPGQTIGLTLAYAAGLSMIFLPCTLPLAFVIVPLSMGQTYKKGFIMALLFGLGLTITITGYFFLITIFGKTIGLDRATMVMLLIAGGAAFLFGLAELGLIKLKMPGGGKGLPKFIQERGDYVKALFMGLFLGNVGAGCPNPAFYVLLTYAASTGDIFYGSGLGFIHGLGRATPLILLSILGIIGINATGWLIKKREVINKTMGWGLLWVGAIIITLGAFGHYWFLNTPFHKGWNRMFMSFGEGVAEYECCIEPACQQCLNGEWIFENGSCLCRMHLEKGHLDKVCPECRKGLAEGKSVFVLEEKTAKYAWPTLAILALGPIPWYFYRKRKK